MSRVDVNGVGIEYQVTGEGRPVVLLYVNTLLLDFLPR
jgi:hypothetical protein